MAINLKDTVQIIRGRKADIAQRTGANGELNWAEDTFELFIHDGKTKGGHYIGGVSGTVKAGNGITVTGSSSGQTVAVKPDSASVVYATSDGVGVRLGNSGAMQITSKGLDLRLVSGGGLVVDANGLKVDSQVLSSVFRYAGQVDSIDDLPDDAAPGDVYDVRDSGANYVWTGTQWDNLGGILSVDSVPTQGSTNPVASGGVYDAIENAKLNGDGYTVSIADNNITAHDVAVDGDTGDLAGDRGQIGNCQNLLDPDFHTILKSGVWRVTGSNQKNAPGGNSLNAILISNATKDGAYCSHIYIRTLESNAVWVETHHAGEGWQPWRRVALDSNFDASTIEWGTGSSIVAKDIAIDGDTGDLAGDRGQIGDAVYQAAKDFHTYTKSGVYFLSGVDTAANHPPYGTNGALVVYASKTGHVEHIFHRIGTPGTNDYQIFTETYAVANDEWSDWHTVITSENVGNGLKMVNNMRLDADYTSIYKTGIDLDDLTEPGRYIVSINTPNQNTPSSNNLYVEVHANPNFGVVQIAYDIGSSTEVGTFIRRKTASSGNWIPWSYYINNAVAQSIGGDKVFTSNMALRKKTPYFNVQSSTGTVDAGIRFVDNDGNLTAALKENMTEKSVSLYKVMSDGDNKSIGIVTTASSYGAATADDTYCYATTTRADPATNEIITYSWVDANVVRTTGDQTISGTKTFTDDLHVQKRHALIRLIDDSMAYDELPSVDTSHGAYVFNAGGSGNGNNRVGYIRLWAHDDGKRILALKTRAIGKTADSDYKGIEIVVPQTGDAYVTVPNTRDTPAANEVITYDYLSSHAVMTTGNQTIGGAKTFTNSIDMKVSGSAVINAYLQSQTKGTIPPAMGYVSYFGYDKSNSVAQQNRLFGLEMGVGPDNTSAALYAYKNQKGVTTRTGIQVFYPNSGDPYSTAPQTRSTPANNEIITYSFLNANYARKSDIPDTSSLQSQINNAAGICSGVAMWGSYVGDGVDDTYAVGLTSDMCLPNYGTWRVNNTYPDHWRPRDVAGGTSVFNVGAPTIRYGLAIRIA